MSAEEGARQRREEKPFDPEAPRESYARSHHFAVNHGEPDAPAIVNAMARAFWVEAWFTREEEEHRSHSGEELMDVAPPTPPGALVLAQDFAAKLAEANGTDLWSLYEKCAHAPGRHLKEPTPKDFGHYMAMEAMRSGAGWWDDHPEVAGGVEVPRVEMPYDLAFENTGLDELDDQTVGQITKALRETAGELADVSLVMALSTADDQSNDTLIEQRMAPETAVWIAEAGDAYAVNGDALISPDWEQRLYVAEQEHPQLWTEAVIMNGSSARSALSNYLQTHGYREVSKLGGEWPAGEEHVGADTLVDTVLERHGAEWGVTTKEIWEVARSLYGVGPGDEIPWSVGGAEVTVYAQRLRS